MGCSLSAYLLPAVQATARSPTPAVPPAVSDLNGVGPEVVPIVTRAWAHDDFGRMVFDWPWAVAYGARIEGKTLTVMFDRRLHTTFQQIPRNLGSYITDVEIGPDGQSVVVSLTNEYRLRTFLLNNEAGGVKVVVDLLADGEAGPVLAQALTPPIPEPSPEAVPGDAHPSPHISGDAPLPLAEAAPETLPADLPPSLPFAVEADAPSESGAEEHPLLGGVPRQRRGGSTDAPPSSPDPNGEQTTEQSAGQAAVPPLETATEPAGADPPRPFDKLRATPPERGEEEAASPVTADADTPPVEPDSPPESAQTAEATPPVETTGVPEPDTEPAPEAVPPTETAAAPEAEAASEETSSAESDATPESVAEPADTDAPSAEPTQETAPESSPPGRPVLSPVEGGAAQRRGGSTDAPPSLDPNGEQVAEQSADQAAVPILETATERAEGNPPRPSATPPERGEESAAPPPVKADAPPAKPTPETAAATEDTPSTETAAEATPSAKSMSEPALSSSPPGRGAAQRRGGSTDSADPDATPDPTPESLNP